jgi:cyclopropane fatty-acyl-phospholipid synthase-like methyltransferase
MYHVKGKNMKLNIIHNNGGLPAHLGGHENETHLDDGALSYLIDRFDIKSYLDIGCGPGGMVDLAASKNLKVLGIDGDYTLERKIPENYVIHDFTVGSPDLSKYGIFDIGWSCEFLEHVEERYMDNYMNSFKSCKRIVVTHAFPGQTGHHHVNEKEPNYWFQNFQERGFLLDMAATNGVRVASTMAQRYIRTSGLVFMNNNLNWQVV